LATKTSEGFHLYASRSSTLRLLPDAARDRVTRWRRDGHTALHMAAFGNHTDMLKLMIENGADVNEKDK
jgi:ankyrin repeat protein